MPNARPSHDESPLAWLRRRKLIGPEAFEAGERLRHDWTLCQLEQRVTMDWQRALTPGEAGFGPRDGLTVSERALAARRRLAKAMQMVGPELSGMLMEVCCMTRGMEAAERALGLPQRSGKVVLELGLTRLARHYGLLPPDTPPQLRGILKSWNLPDYRPSIPEA
jgi:hypothetical protein